MKSPILTREEFHAELKALRAEFRWWILASVVATSAISNVGGAWGFGAGAAALVVGKACVALFSSS